MNKKIALLLAAGALVAGAFNAQAATITGIISFSTESGTWTGDGGNVNTIESILDFGDVEVDFATDSFAGLEGDSVTMGQPLRFVAPVSIVNPLWSVGGFSFDMTAITDVTRNDTAGLDTLVLNGIGTITDGVDSVSGSWVWSGDMQGTATFTFSSSTVAAVPDGGATAMLLGLGVLGLAGIRRKLS